MTQMQWDQPPEVMIDPSKTYYATFKTPKGSFRVRLLADKAPKTVNNFVFLAQQGFYDDTTFHRVLEGFMDQGGDPAGTGMGGPGYRFEDEIHPDLKFDQEGLLAMANAGPGTNGSQFFITYGPADWLTGRHTIFGVVVKGLAVAKGLKRRDPQRRPDYPGETLESVTIEQVD